MPQTKIKIFTLLESARDLSKEYSDEISAGRTGHETIERHAEERAKGYRNLSRVVDSLLVALWSFKGGDKFPTKDELIQALQNLTLER